MNAMMRNIVGSLLALVGAAAAVWSPFRAWYEGREGRDFRLTELFTGTGISDGGADLLASPFLPFAIAAVLTVAAIALRSRALQALAAITVLGFTALWMVRQAMADGSLTFAGDGTGVDHGIGLALGGGALMLLAAGVMGGRRKRRGRAVEAGREQDEVLATSPTSTTPQHTTWTGGAGAPAYSRTDETQELRPYGQEPYGQEPYGREPYGREYGQEPYGREYRQEPYGREYGQGTSAGSGGRYWQGEPTDREEYEYPQAGHGRHRSGTTAWGSDSSTGAHGEGTAADHRTARSGHRRKWPKIPQNH